MTDDRNTSSRELAYGILALFPAVLYAAGTALSTGYGRPFMITFLYGPGSNHTTIGLLLLLFGKILCPLAASVIGLRLVRRGDRLVGWILLLAGLGLLLLGLATRQPYAV